MNSLKYKIIKNKKQYAEYCNQLEELVNTRNKTKATKDEAELLTVLIEKWDNEHNSFQEADPVEVLKIMMEEQQIKPVALAEYLGVSKGLISDVLNYKKGMSKHMIRKLAERFKVSQELFNRHYKLFSPPKNKQIDTLHRKKRAA